MLSKLRNFESIFPLEDCTYAQDFANSFKLLDSLFGFLNCKLKDHHACDHSIRTLDSYVIELQKLKELWIELIGESAITPYFHVLEYHVYDMLQRSPFGSLAPFALSSQELKHQIQTRIQFRRTNHGALQTKRSKAILNK